MIDNRPAYLAFYVSGEKALQCFQHETGGHRVQRNPPTEKRGRIHTSTITVSVLEEQKLLEIKIDPSDLEWKTCRGHGKGGQHRNVTDSAVQLTHRPSKTQIRVESERSQKQNKETALSLLRVKLYEEQQAQQDSRRSQLRKKQVGSGMRADKIRTIRMQDGRVTDHRLKRKTSLRKYLRGDFSDLWD